MAFNRVNVQHAKGIDPMTSDTFQRKLTAILSADVVGYSRLMGDDEAATVKTLETYKGVMFSLIKQHRGRVVDSPGDNLLAEFGSVVDAVQCAVSIQKELQMRNADLPENRRMEFRIGINLGDVIEEEDRIYGDGVNIAARLEALADPGGICVSKTAFDHIESRLPLGYEFLGEQTVKNIGRPVGAYKVLMETRVVDASTKREARTVSFWQRKAVLSFGIILILAIVGVLCRNFYLRGPSIEPASIDRMAYPLPDKPSIAVLPFTNMSGDPEQDYIGDGLSENIISTLSVSSKLFVIARNSTFTYKGKPVKVQQVAEDLGVQYVLEGSILKSGDQLRVTAQLIDSLSGYHLWSDVYDREMRELFDLLDEITKKIVVSLQVELSDWGEDLRLYAKSTNNLEAWKYYVKGTELYQKFNSEDNAKAREHYEVALELDPEFVVALRGLALTHLIDATQGWGDSPLTSMNRAFELAEKAVDLDKQDPGAHSVLGMVFLYQRQYEKAIAEGELAITLNPNYESGHVNLAITMLNAGRFEEAITLTKKAYRLNPNRSTIWLFPQAASYIFLGRYEEALEVCKQMEVSKQMEESDQWTLFLSWLYQELGREEEARSYMAKALRMNTNLSLKQIEKTLPYRNPAYLQRVLDAYRKAGMPEKAPGAAREKPSIAVLPFENLSPDPEQEYFVDGLSEELITYLSKIPDLQVTSRTSSFSFKDTDKTVKEIAEILEREYILEGSVRKTGNALRITVQLIRAADDSHLWSATYDRELKDIFKIQEDIANNVADKLKLTLEAFQLLGGTENIQAYELYLNAKGKRAEGTVSGVEKALDLLDKAIALDPEFALAWAFKAHNHIVLNIHGPSSRSKEEANAATKAALKAIELEPNLGEAYFNLGYVESVKGEWSNAELDYRKALELIVKPLSGDNHPIAVFYTAVGHFKRVLESLDEMRRNDPKHPDIGAWFNLTYGLIGDRQRAEDGYKSRDRSMAKGYSNWHDIVITDVRLGSRDVLSRADILSTNKIHIALKNFLNTPEKGLIELHRIYTTDEDLSSSDLSRIAIWAAYFGDDEFAMKVEEKAISINAESIVPLWYPLMREVRQLPRFRQFVREIGLVDYWDKFGWPDLCHPVGDDDFVCDMTAI